MNLGKAKSSIEEILLKINKTGAFPNDPVFKDHLYIFLDSLREGRTQENLNKFHTFIRNFLISGEIEEENQKILAIICNMS